MRRNRLWRCELAHVLDDNGFHIISLEERVHGRVTVPVEMDDDYSKPVVEKPTVIKHEVSVVHSHKPRPRPNTMAFRLRSWDGREYRTSPANIYGQASTPLHFPLQWLTGRDEDLKTPDVQIIAEFWYPEES